MAVTLKAGFDFTNLIKTDHIGAYFRKKLGWGNFAYKRFIGGQGTPGDTITFPYFDKIADAQAGTENTALTVQSMGDNKFTATVAEAALAWGATDHARKRGGMTEQEWDNEGLAQAGRLMAEKVDADILTHLTTTANAAYTNGRTAPANVTLTTDFTSAKGKDTTQFQAEQCNIRSVRDGLTEVFGDKQDEVVALVFHSRCLNDLITEDKAGLLKADANSPFNMIAGFRGMLLGKAVFEMDTAPKGTTVTYTDNSAATQKYAVRNVVALKKDPYALIIKQNPSFEAGRDQLKRLDIYSTTQWYAVQTLHKKISADDQRVAFLPFITTEEIA